MVLTGKVFLPLVILVGSLIVAAIFVKNRGMKFSQANIVSPPLIGEINRINREGPWPECVGLLYQDCAALVELYTTDVAMETIERFHEGDKPNDFDPNRVIIFVDESDIVTRIPHKG